MKVIHPVSMKMIATTVPIILVHDRLECLITGQCLLLMYQAGLGDGRLTPQMNAGVSLGVHRIAACAGRFTS